MNTSSPRVPQVPIAVIVTALASFATGYIMSPCKVATVTESTTITEATVSAVTITTTVYRDINVTVYSQDLDVNLSVSPVYLSFFPAIDKLRVYVANNGNTSKINLLLVVVFKSQYGYEAEIVEIDAIEPGVTLRYGIDTSLPATRYYVAILK